MYSTVNLAKEMEKICQEKKIFDSIFDSFELDDGFLNKIDVDLKKSVVEKINVSKDKPEDSQRGKENRMIEKKMQHCHSPVFIEDSNDSDFFDFGSKEKKQSLKVDNDGHEGKQNKQLWNKGFISCLSPILGNKVSRSLNLSSSTPERQGSESNSKKKIKLKENSLNSSDCVLLEPDLFDEWDVDSNKKEITEKETVTISQALELIKEAKQKVESDEESQTGSIDLLTGEVVGSDVGVLFEESFNLPKSLEKKHEDKKCSNESLIITSKPPAAQKLNFESEKISAKKPSDSENLKDFCFSSDDDLDFFTQDLLKKTKKIPDHEKKTDSNAPIVIKSSSASSVRDSDLNESSDCQIVLNKKRGKGLVIAESDTTEDSPSPKFLRQNNAKKAKKRKSLQENFRKEFLDLEAEVSDEASSDEIEEDGEYDKSFLDEAAYLTQNFEANMTAKYLESVKAIDRGGTFKIPPAKPYSPANVFSQIPEESNSDYEFDSFCVKDVEEEEPRTDLSDLEVAEKILEMDRKKKRKKRSQKLRKLN